MTWYSCTSFEAYLFCSPTNLDARCNASSFCVPRFFLPSFFLSLLITRHENARRKYTLSVVSSGCRDTPRSAERVSRPPLGSFPNLFHFLKTFLKHDDADVFLERIKDIKYRIFYESSTGKWKRKKKICRAFFILQRVFSFLYSASIPSVFNWNWSRSIWYFFLFFFFLRRDRKTVTDIDAVIWLHFRIIAKENFT